MINIETGGDMAGEFFLQWLSRSNDDRSHRENVLAIDSGCADGASLFWNSPITGRSEGSSMLA
jgi:hypothetical protein